MNPVIVRRDVMIAYERRAGFPGLGDFLEQKGKIVLSDGAELCQSIVQE